MSSSAKDVTTQDAKWTSFLSTYSVAECPLVIRNRKQSQACHLLLLGDLHPAKYFAGSPTPTTPLSFLQVMNDSVLDLSRRCEGHLSPTSLTTHHFYSKVNINFTTRLPDPEPQTQWQRLNVLKDL